MSSVNAIFVSIIKTDRKATCQMLKSLDMGNEELYSKIADAPIPDVPKALTKKTKDKKEKSTKPRRISAYILFSNDFRMKSKEEGKVMKPKEALMEASAAWNAVDDETRKFWTDKAKAKFEEVVAAYKETHPDYDPNAKPVKTSKEQIPRGKSAYILYISHMGKTEGKENGKNLMKNAAAKWAEMSDEEKEPFNKLSDATKKEATMFRRYATSIKAELIDSGVEDDKKSLDLATLVRWNELSDEEKEIDEIVPEKKKKTKKEQKAEIPKSKSAYNHFVAQFNGEVPEGEKHMAVAGEKWKSLSDDEREPFIEMSETSKEVAKEFKEFMAENESVIREEIADALAKETDEKKQKKLITQQAAEKWAIYKSK